MFKKSILIFLLVFGLALTGLVAFGAETPREGGTVVIPAPYGGSITSLDPALSNRNQSTLVFRNIFENLVEIQPNTLEVVPGIAKDWDVSDDGLTYTFYMREGVKFHNGSEVTASDVKYTYERLMDPEVASVGVDLFNFVEGAQEFKDGEADHISGIKILDDYTIEITLTKLSPNFLYSVAGGSNYNAAIVPKDVVEEVGDNFTNKPIGSGPFKFEKWNRGSSVELSAFEDYYGEGPYLDKLIVRVMEEAPAREAAFRSNELDFNIVYPAQYKRYKNDPQYADFLVEVAELWTRNVTFNMELEKLQDKRVRQAFNYAIDEKLINDRLLNGKAYAARGWLPNSSPAFNSDLEPYGYDHEKARELMEEAGYTQKNPLKLKINGVDHPAWGIPMVEAIKPYLDRVGFKIEPVLLD
ncbi:MAG: ABC transporter substrate-binding protein, partial [Candidatus Bipolaricaulota bacterium]